MDSGFLLLCTQILHYPGTCLGSRTWPPLHLDAVVAMRSESRTDPRAMAAAIFSLCFFGMPVFVCRTADRHTRAALRKKGKHSQAHAGVCTDGRDAQRPRECVLEDCTRFDLRGLSHTPPTFRGPDLGHLTDFCPRGLVGFAVNAEDERPDNPELLQALLDRANRARRGAVVFLVCVSSYCTVQ
jgi:hypothetical protein